MSICAFWKALLRPISAVLAAVMIGGFIALPAAYAADAAKTQVPVGTIVDLVFDSAINPQTVAIGQSIQIRVASAVLVNGKTVIQAGARAMGEVSLVSKAGAVGKEAQIGIVVKSVPAVDGTIIPLDGSKVVTGESHQTSSLVITLLCCILGLLQKGGQAEIAAGSSVRATVAAPVEIAVP